MNDLKHDIERYQKGEMSPQEMHAMESKALDDPFLADALEGSSFLSPEDFSHDVSALKKKIIRKPSTGWYWPVRIAAAITLLAVATFLLWPTNDDPASNRDLALQNEIETKTEPDEKSEASGEESVVNETTKSITSDSQPEVEERLSLNKSTKDVSESAAKEIAKIEKPVANDQEKGPVTIAKADANPTIKIPFQHDTLKTVEALTDISKAAADDAGKGEDVVSTDLAVAAESLKVDDRKVELASRSMVNENKVARKKKAEVTEPAAGYSSVTPSITRKISGRVTSTEDGSPIPGVNVVIDGTTIGTVTDISGRYEIIVNSSNPTLVFSFIGFQTYEKEISDAQNSVDVQLALDTTQLSEVIVAGYSGGDTQPEESTVDLAHPEIGFREFKKYLESNLRYPEEAIEKKVEGRVTVEFTVESNGSLTEFNVVRGIGSGCDDELIRLIKDSKWIPTKKNSMPVKDKARVRLKFDLPK